MIPLYHETCALRETVEKLLADVPLEPTASRREFGTLLANADVGIIGLGRCSATDVQWLREVSRGGLLAPSCIVITPLSIGRLQRLREIESERIHVVWAEETDDRLVDVITEIAPWHDDPLRLLGRRILAASAPHQSVAEAIRRICNLSGHRPPRPARDVGHRAGIQPGDLGRLVPPLLAGGNPPHVRPQDAAELGRAPLGVSTASPGQVGRSRQAGGDRQAHAGAIWPAACRLHARRGGP